MTSRRYIKRVWRVPKDKGPAAYLAALVVKALVKHGWPAKSVPLTTGPGFAVKYGDSFDLPDDFAQAVSIAVRIAARTHRLDLTETHGVVMFNRPYRVSNCHFVEDRE
ncbi:MAG: hypothetical protein H3C51_04610 [Rubellimicrobium sp.]|nr:hypothetical protein [Rubellimicrobium sp.]